MAASRQRSSHIPLNLLYHLLPNHANRPYLCVLARTFTSGDVLTLEFRLTAMTLFVPSREGTIESHILA